MFHPLLPDMSELKTADVENKIYELTKKYWIAARSGNGYLGDQILIVIEAYKTELQKRNQAATKISTQNGNKDLDDLIKIQ